MTTVNKSTADIDAANAVVFEKAVFLLKHRDSSKEKLQIFFAEDDVMREHLGVETLFRLIPM
ncbi:MAG: hypothetical protein COB23_07200 [Methylophaga sp.]|nr:MAG: hypothetical protein COB23_07200 [Methylophaga sp.]